MAELASTIDGNLEADQCLTVGMNTAIIGGNVRIQNCTVQSGYEDAEIGGNFACNNNSAACVARNGNVYGNVQINDNLSAESLAIRSAAISNARATRPSRAAATWSAAINKANVPVFEARGPGEPSALPTAGGA